MKYTVLAIRDRILDKKIKIFSTRDFGSLLAMSSRKSLYYLENGVEKGLFIQLKRGFYCLKTDPPTDREIANCLYRPSYLSFEYALAYYHIIPEMVYRLTSATTKPTREFVVEDKTYVYTAIKLSAYAGYELKTTGDEQYVIAEPEKSLVDYLYLVSLGRRQPLDRLRLATIDTQRVKEYAKLFHRSSLLTLVDSVMKQGTQ